MSLHLAVVQEFGYGDARLVKTELHRFAHLGPAARSPHVFAPGEGIIGQAFRGRREVVFRKMGQQGSQFYLARLEPETGGEPAAQKPPIHSILYCIPLPVIESRAADVPAYGVLSLGTFEDRSGLRQLNSPPTLAALIDVVRGTLNRQIQEIVRI